MLAVAAICVLVGLLAAPAFPQRGPEGRSAAARPPGPGVRRGPAARPRGTPRNAVDRWNAMSPEARRRALEKLPPDRQRQIRERIERFNSLPPEEQQRLRERYRQFSRLSPEKQDLLRRQMRAFSQLPEDRRKELTREFEELREMPEGERRARIESGEFRARYTPREQQILQDLSENLAIPLE